MILEVGDVGVDVGAVIAFSGRFELDRVGCTGQGCLRQWRCRGRLSTRGWRTVGISTVRRNGPAAGTRWERNPRRSIDQLAGRRGSGSHDLGIG